MFLDIFAFTLRLVKECLTVTLSLTSLSWYWCCNLKTVFVLRCLILKKHIKITLTTERGKRNEFFTVKRVSRRVDVDDGLCALFALLIKEWTVLYRAYWQ